MYKFRIFGYSLSRNFQLGENILTMRMILPIDLTYALGTVLGQSLAICIRMFRAKLNDQQFMLMYDMLNTVITILIFRGFPYKGKG